MSEFISFIAVGGASSIRIIYEHSPRQSSLFFLTCPVIQFFSKVIIEEALDVIEAASTGSLGEVCVTTEGFKSLPADVALDSRRYDMARQKTEMTAMMLRNLGTAEAMRRNGKLM